MREGFVSCEGRSFPLLALVPSTGLDTQKLPPSEEMNEILVDCEIASFKVLSFCAEEIGLPNNALLLESFIKGVRSTDDSAICAPFVESAGRAK